MNILKFSFNGDQELVLPDGDMAVLCAQDIIEGRSYPLPMMAKPKVVVDIGAHAGEFTVMAALLWPGATIHAFEPYPPIVAMLRQNVRNFPNVIIHEKAVDAIGAAEVPKLRLSSFGTLCHSLYDHPNQSGETLDVDVVSPTAIAALEPDILKVDAEGAEFAIMFGMPFRSVAQIERIYLEFHKETHRRALDDLLDRTHSLTYARIMQAEQGEVTYVRRKN